MCYVTGIGSKIINADEGWDLVNIFYHVASIGGILRSGDALGSDSASAYGYLQAYREGLTKEVPELYVGWDNWYAGKNLIGRKFLYPDLIIKPSELEYWNEASEIMETIHPAPHYLKRGGYGLHTRNIFQVLGRDLNTPSKMVIYCADETPRSGVKGGTRTAWKLAVDYGIPVYNLRYGNMRELSRFVERNI